MKVCHLIDHMGLGGAQRLVVNLVEARANPIEPHVVSLRDRILDNLRQRLASSGAQYHTLSLSKGNPAGWFRLRQAIRQGRFDVVHAHLDYSTSFGIAAALSLGASRPRTVSNFYADPMKLNSLVYRAFVRRLAPYVDVHIAPGPAVAEIMAGMLGAAAGRIEVVPLGLDLPELNAQRTDPQRVKVLRGGAKHVVGFVGRLAEQKDVGSLLRAIPAVLNEAPSTKFLIVGDGPLRSSLQRDCARLGIVGAVNFTGYLADVVNAYGAMDVLAFATKYEGLPLTVVEAMAMGVPIVASNVTGVADIVQHGANGLLVPESDSSALAANITRILLEPGLGQSLRDAACKISRERYSRERMAKETEAIYASIVSD